MGLTNIYAKYIIIPFLLLGIAYGQVNVTTIPGKLKILVVPNSPALNDSVVSIDVSGNIKKIATPGGGGSATGVNGLSGTTNIGLGGTLTGNTVETLNGHTFTLLQGSTGNLQLWNNTISGTVAQIANNGQYFGQGLSNIATGNNAQVSTSTAGVFINRTIADSHNVLNVQNASAGSTGDVGRFYGAAGGLWFSIGYNGFLNRTSYVISSAGAARSSIFTDVLQPTANNDLLVAYDLHPVFGTSIINSLNTLVGGTGYGTSTYNVTLTGGTGSGATATLTSTAGAITGVAILSAGVNYTIGDVLSATVTDMMGNVIGSGFSIKVSGVTSYTGVTGYALRTYGLDQYDQDYSATYTANTKVAKSYVDNKVRSGSYSLFGSATTTFTVTIGVTMPNNTYKVQVTPTNALGASSNFYVTNKTLTTFDIVYPAGLSGTFSADWSVLQ